MNRLDAPGLAGSTGLDGRPRCSTDPRGRSSRRVETLEAEARASRNSTTRATDLSLLLCESTSIAVPMIPGCAFQNAVPTSPHEPMIRCGVVAMAGARRWHRHELEAHYSHPQPHVPILAGTQLGIEEADASEHRAAHEITARGSDGNGVEQSMKGIPGEMSRIDLSSYVPIEVDLVPAREEHSPLRPAGDSLRESVQGSRAWCIVSVEKLDQLAAGLENAGIARDRQPLIRLPTETIRSRNFATTSSV